MHSHSTATHKNSSPFKIIWKKNSKKQQLTVTWHCLSTPFKWKFTMHCVLKTANISLTVYDLRITRRRILLITNRVIMLCRVESVLTQRDMTNAPSASEFMQDVRLCWRRDGTSDRHAQRGGLSLINYTTHEQRLHRINFNWHTMWRLRISPLPNTDNHNLATMSLTSLARFTIYQNEITISTYHGNLANKTGSFAAVVHLRKA